MLTDIIHRFIKNGFTFKLQINDEVVYTTVSIQKDINGEFVVYATAKYPNIKETIEDLSKKLEGIEAQGNFPL